MYGGPKIKDVMSLHQNIPHRMNSTMPSNVHPCSCVSVSTLNVTVTGVADRMLNRS